MGFKEFMGRLWFGAKKNAPKILTVGGISLMVTGTVLAVKATPDAMEAIEEKKKEEGHERLTLVQTIQATWKCYIKSALSIGVGSFCLIEACREGDKRQAALMATVESGRNVINEFMEYRRFVAERVGAAKEAEIYNQTAQEMVNRNPPPPDMPDKTVADGQAPKPMCFDYSFGRYYYVDYETAREAVNKLNNEINTGLNGYVSLNDFYSEIRVSTTDIGDMVGWSTETGLIEIPDKEDLRYAGTPGGWPCWVLEFTNPPQYEYQFFRKRTGVR